MQFSLSLSPFSFLFSLCSLPFVEASPPLILPPLSFSPSLVFVSYSSLSQVVMNLRSAATVALRGWRRCFSTSSNSGSIRASINQDPNSDHFISDMVGTYGGTFRERMMNYMATVDINSQIGSCMPLSAMRIGTMIHNIEMNPGQGGKFVRAAGTWAKILKEPTSRYCLIRLPSGTEKLIDSRCRATIGQVSNPSHGSRKLRKAGHSRWLGRRPVVRGVAMNPVDHPHGGGEGRSKSSGSFGRGSRTPWGKPTKSGYKTGPLKCKK